MTGLAELRAQIRGMCAVVLAVACLVSGKPVPFRDYFEARNGLKWEQPYVSGERLDDAYRRLADTVADYNDCLARRDDHR